MRFFELANLQDVILYIFPTLIFILVFATGLGFMVLKTKDSENRKKRILYRFPDDIEDRNAPYPLVMIWIIAGTLLWMFGYILLTGLLGVKI